MSRTFLAAAAQLGPVARSAPVSQTVRRLVLLLEQAAARGCSFVVFPEMALTTFFPRWLIEDEAEVASFFHTAMPDGATETLFEAAAHHGVGFYLGYCEQAGDQRFNTAVLVDRSGAIVGKYRKVHLPGNARYDGKLKLQHLEPWYFQPGDLGFRVFETLGGRIGMLICNDRRWPEPYRVMALQGVELICLGYNSPAQLPDHPVQNSHRTMHHLVPMQAAAYQNGTWVIASAKAGHEEGCDLMGLSAIIAPSGEVVAISSTLGDELVTHEVDLDLTVEYKKFFDFENHRRPECYGLITERKVAGDVLPD